MTNIASLFVFSLVGASISLVWIVLLRKTPIGQKLLDVPNNRSSHQIPVARGAGFAFAICALVAGLLFETTNIIAVGFIGFLVACVGLVDDALNISARVRFSFQIILCILALWPFGPSLHSSFLIFSPIVLLVIFLYLQSTINFYNFADGINGHIALQFMVAIVSWAVFSANRNYISNFSEDPVVWVLAGALIVFLIANMHLRWVFMGDSGSTFLGFFVIAFPIYQLNLTVLQPIHWLIFFSAMFVFNFIIWTDCIAILVTKTLCRIGFSQAHRNHLYQQLSRRPRWGHSRTSFVLAFWQISISLCFVAFVNGSQIWGGLCALLCLLYLAVLVSASLKAAKDFLAIAV